MTTPAPRDTATHAWKKLRKQWEGRLPLTCPYCALPINPGDAFDLDHAIPTVLGGSALDGVRPAHPGCNRRHGVNLGRAMRTARRQYDQAKPTGNFRHDLRAGFETADRDW